MRALWDRLPVPAEHVATMAAALVLLRLSPRRLPMALSAPGWPLAAAGVALNVWALRSRGGGDLERPVDLVTNGAYAWSRNPMYVGWSLVHLGVGMGTRTPWVVATWPIAAVLTHGQILREEQLLAARFTDTFTTYLDDVPRYARAP